MPCQTLAERYECQCGGQAPGLWNNRAIAHVEVVQLRFQVRVNHVTDLCHSTRVGSGIPCAKNLASARIAQDFPYFFATPLQPLPVHFAKLLADAALFIKLATQRGSYLLISPCERKKIFVPQLISPDVADGNAVCISIRRANEAGLVVSQTGIATAAWGSWVAGVDSRTYS